MREIIFRAKRKDNGEWVYGSLLIQAGERINKDELTPVEYRILGCRGENHLVAPKTVGQYTGLCDKNGIKIFEGDILKGLYANGNAEVEMINGSWVGYAGKGWTDIGYVVDRVEVIGNVHDNPELLNK